MTAAARPETTKTIRLLVAIVLVFVCALWRVYGAMVETPRAHPASDKVVAMGADHSAGGGHTASPSPAVAAPTPLTAPPAASTEAMIPDRDAGDVASSEDPFRPFDPDPADASSTLVAAKGTPLAPGPLTPLPFASAVPAHDPASTQALTPAEAALPMRLTGVVVGPHPTAVVSVGEDEIVVRPGSLLPDGSTLVKIDAMSVTVTRKGQKSVLSIIE